MKFHLIADATFEADDLPDAFIRLAEHFESLPDYMINGSDRIYKVSTPKFFETGRCQVTEVGHEFTAEELP